MRTKKNREINIISLSFLDVLANAVGGLAFLLIFAVLLIGAIVFAPPEITTEGLPDGYHNQAYVTWLGAREGLGKFLWSFGAGERPQGLSLEPETGKLSGVLALAPSDGSERKFEFIVNCESNTEDTQGKPKLDSKRFALFVHRERPVHVVPLRIMTEATLPAAYLQQPYPLVLAAEGGQPPYTWSGALPPGLTLTKNGYVTGKPGEVGEFTFDVVVSTPHGERQSKKLLLAVSENYPPPPPIPPLKVLTRRLPAAVADREYEVQLAAQGGTPPYSWTAISGLPVWLRAHADASAFVGTPGLLDIGQSKVVWQVSDNRGQAAQSDAVLLEVLPPAGEKPPPLRMKTPSLPDARAGQPYTLAVAVEGGFPPYKWTVSAVTPEHGVVFSTTDGTLSGVPKRMGSLLFPVAVTDKAGQSVTAELALRVRPALLPVGIVTTQAPIGRVEQHYTLALAAVGGFPPYRWRLVEGQLPPGLVLDETSGRVSGIPQEAGTWRARLAVADAEAQGAPEPLTIPVEILTRRGTRRLVITTRALPILLVDKTSETTLAAEGGTEPYTWHVSGTLPAGLALDAGRITGTPTKAGNYKVELSVTDSTGERAVAGFILTIEHMVPYWLVVLLTILVAIAGLMILWLARAHARQRPVPLCIMSESIPNARASSDYAVQLACMGGVPPYRWRVTEGEIPPGMTLSPEGKLSGFPFEGILVNATKDVPFTVEVVDQLGNKAARQL